MKSLLHKKVWIILFGIILLASALRFWQLGHVPISPDWDEASLGYNAYSILHTGKDEYGQFLPIVFKSFGDYKPALYSYLAIPSILIFGLDVFAVRLPSALFGVLTVLITFFLVKELFKRNNIALLASFLLAISPWHIQFSRVAFETNVGLAFNVIGVFLFVKSLKKPWLLIPSALTLALNLYVYQSEKVFTPLLVLLLLVIYFKQILHMPKKVLVSAAIVGFLVIIPMVSFTLFNKSGLARAASVSIFSSTSTVYKINQTRYQFNKSRGDVVGLVLDNGRLEYAKTIVENYISHFDVNWLFILGDIGRHHAPDMGILYLWELPCIAIGLFQLLFGKYETKTKLVVFGWLLLAPVPASITTDVPHAVRTITMLPMWQIFSAIGVLTVFHFFKSRKYKQIPYGYITLTVFLMIALLNFVYYLDQYFVQLNYIDALDWQYGYAKIVPETVALGKSYHRVIVSNEGQFGQSYIFYLFYMKYDPALYQKQSTVTDAGIRSFGKYTFEPIDWANNQKVTGVLFVGSTTDFPSPVLGFEKAYNAPDGKPFAEVVRR